EADVRPDELATEASFPVLPPAAGCAFAEVSRRHGDYAVCGVAALVELDAEGIVSRARAAYLALAGAPLVLDLTSACGDVGGDLTEADFAEAGRLAMSQVRPTDDIHATASYRRHLAGVLTERALHEAHQQARGRANA